jgi:Spy/CpxP family protein refolding chaperone
MMQGHHKGHRGMDGMMLQKLNLSEDQKAQFKSQHEAFRKQMEELKKNDNITVKEWRSKMENLRKDNKEKLQGILTSDQKAQMEKMKQEGKAKQEEMMKKRVEMMKTRLGLTDEQSAKLQKNHKDLEQQMRSIHENKSLTDDQRKEQMKNLMQKNKESLKSILTEEQLKKLKEGHRKPDGEKRKPEGPNKTI